MTELLFVYGTLMQGFQSPVACQFNKATQFSGTATMKGRLFDVGGYPGAIFDQAGNTRVHGELYTVHDVAVFDILDEYENCNSTYAKPWEYRRRQLPYEQNGVNGVAWAYEYNWPLNVESNIPTGNYRDC